MNRKINADIQCVSPLPEPGGLRILRLRQVEQATGLKRSTIYELQAQGRFPRSVKISDRGVGWAEHEVQTWIHDRLTKTDAQGKSKMTWPPQRRAI